MLHYFKAHILFKKIRILPITDSLNSDKHRSSINQYYLLFIYQNLEFIIKSTLQLVRTMTLYGYTKLYTLQYAYRTFDSIFKLRKSHFLF